MGWPKQGWTYKYKDDVKIKHMEFKSHRQLSIQFLSILLKLGKKHNNNWTKLSINAKNFQIYQSFIENLQE